MAIHHDGLPATTCCFRWQCLLVLTKVHTKHQSLSETHLRVDTQAHATQILHYVCATRRKCFVAGPNESISPFPVPDINSNFPRLQTLFPAKLQAISCCWPALALFQLEQPVTNSLVTQHNCGEWWRLLPTLGASDGNIAGNGNGSEERHPPDVGDMWVTIVLVTNWTGPSTARKHNY